MADKIPKEDVRRWQTKRNTNLGETWIPRQLFDCLSKLILTFCHPSATVLFSSYFPENQSYLLIRSHFLPNRI
jgi:hypothetical protein